MASRKRSKGSSQSKTPPIQAERLKRQEAVEPRSLLRHNDLAYKAANTLIAKVVLASAPSEITEIDKISFLLSCRLSGQALPGYSTLDKKHVTEIKSLVSTIKRYANDASQARPLNFLMLASPGTGKSHFIKCVGELLEPNNIKALTYDLTALEKSDDLIPQIEGARNQKVVDKLPLLFLDEFDSRPANVPMLLPLLWDGEINLGRQNLKLGKVVIVLAGSSSRLPEVMQKAKTMQRELAFDQDTSHKIVDLLSRINGGTIAIPPFRDPASGIDRRAGKICAAVHLLRQRFGKSLKVVPVGLFRFIFETEFRYGVRSIHHLIDQLPYKKGRKGLRDDDLKLPMESAEELSRSSLIYHLLRDDQDLKAIVSDWQRYKKVDAWLPLYHQEDDLYKSGLVEGDQSADDETIAHYNNLIKEFDGIAAKL